MGGAARDVSGSSPPDDIGTIGGGSKKPTDASDVALIQSLVRKGEVSDLIAGYGHLVVDECHHLSAASFEFVARRSKADMCSAFGDRGAAGRAPSDHLHAVRAGAISRRPEGAGRATRICASRDVA